MDYSNERHKAIMACLDAYGKISVVELAHKFEVTSATIRRDLTNLERQHKLQRVHGGAVKYLFLSEEPEIEKRRLIYISEKIKVASMASRLIQDNMSIFLDVGTTIAQMIPLILGKQNLTVITNSIDVMVQLSKFKLSQQFMGKLIFIGGEINEKQQAVSGSISQQFSKKFFVDMAFIAVGGIHLSGGITGYDERETLLSKQMIEQCKEAVVLVDHSKIGVRNLYQIAPLKAINCIICDIKFPEEWRKALEFNDVEWMYE
jgi:DeoR/GlpR family transcriptional regulator of sugar metabolism